MDEYGDITSDMGDESLSQEQIEQLITGNIDPQLHFGALARLAELVSAAKMPATSEELKNEGDVVGYFKNAQRLHSVRNIREANQRKIHSSLLAAKIAGVLVTATALTGTAVAAYHGDLPNTFQTTVSSGLARVGISVPATRGSSGGATTSSLPLPKAAGPLTKSSVTVQSSTSTSSTNAQSGLNNYATQQLASGSSVYGLCRAYLNSPGSANTAENSTTTTLATGSFSSHFSSGGSSSSSDNGSASQISGPVALRWLEALAAKQGTTVSQLCSTVTRPDSSGGSSDTAGSGHFSQGLRGDGHSFFTSSAESSATNSSTTTTSVENRADLHVGTQGAPSSVTGSKSLFFQNPFNEILKEAGFSVNEKGGSSLSRWNRSQ